MKYRSNPFYFFLGTVFLTGIGLGFLAWNHIVLPFSNPMEVVGPPTLLGLNPYDDVLRFGVFVFLPSALLLLFYFLNGGRIRKGLSGWPSIPKISTEKKNRQDFYFVIVLILFAALLSLNIPTYHAFGQFDPFHEGESLGAAMSAMDHQVPYRDYFFFHGLIQDPLRSAWAFQWFGQSIGAQRTLESIFKVFTWMLLALFLAKVFRSNRFFALTALILTAVFSIPFLFDVLVEPLVRPHEPQNIVAVFNHWQPWLAPFHWIILSGRDLLSMAFLLSFLSLLKRAGGGTPHPFKLFFSAFGFALIPLLALVHSVDRGIYLVTAGFIFSGWFILFFSKKENLRAAYIGGLLAGWTFGIGTLGYCLQWNYAGFLNFVFGVLPRYKLLTDALPYPIRDPRYLFPVVLLAFYIFRVGERFLRLMGQKKRSLIETLRVFLAEDGVLLVLLTLALFNFRNVLERPVLDHLAYNFIFIFLVVLVDIFRAFQLFFENRLFQKISRGTLVFAVILAGFSLYRLAAFDQWGRNFPLKTDDASYLTDDRRQVIEFLKTELKNGEPFFALTNDASWYYLLNRPSPTPYPCLWVAAPKAFQQQVVESLERKKIRIVLYKNSFWGSSIDDIPDLQRFPVITQYVQNHYVPYKKIADQEIWILKN